MLEEEEEEELRMVHRVHPLVRMFGAKLSSFAFKDTIELGEMLFY